MGFSLRELIRAIALTRLLDASHQPPLPAAFPSPLGCLVSSRSHSFHCASGTIRLSDYSGGVVVDPAYYTPRAELRFPLRYSLIGSLILTPLRNPTSPPGVTLKSSVPCRPHTPFGRLRAGSWYDGWMSDAFASIVQARPCPIPSASLRTGFGRPVHHGISPSIAARYFSSCPWDSTVRLSSRRSLTVDTLPSGGQVEDRFGLLPMSVGSLASSFTPRFRASASISQTLDTQRASPAPRSL